MPHQFHPKFTAILLLYKVLKKMVTVYTHFYPSEIFLVSEPFLSFISILANWILPTKVLP